MDINFQVLEGKTIKEIHGATEGSEEIIIITSDGHKYKMYHPQSCCENVSLSDIIGDIKDLVGNTILLAEEVVSNDDPSDKKETNLDYSYPDSFTWTFYKLSTIKGSVTLRWYGESNGYYSESVDFVSL